MSDKRYGSRGRILKLLGEAEKQQLAHQSLVRALGAEGVAAEDVNLAINDLMDDGLLRFSGTGKGAPDIVYLYHPEQDG